jgi:peptide deformylase
MPVRPVLRWPDPRLSQVAVPVTAFDSSLTSVVADLLDTLRSTTGVGIAGPHIGVLQRIIVLELEKGLVQVYVNPVIEERGAEMARHMEGSISMQGLLDEVDRPATLTLTYRTVTGESRRESASGFPAACLQHEIDQLDGVFWLYRLSRLKRDRLIRKYEKMPRG